MSNFAAWPDDLPNQSQSFPKPRGIFEIDDPQHPTPGFVKLEVWASGERKLSYCELAEDAYDDVTMADIWAWLDAVDPVEAPPSLTLERGGRAARRPPRLGPPRASSEP